MTTKIYPPIHKTKSRAFGKDCYLLGRYKDGKTFWLEEPQWECSWYWGFGSITTYTQANPALARDIDSHSHYDSTFTGKAERYSPDKQCVVADSTYRLIISHNEDVSECVLSTPEQWLLSEYMQTAYTLQKAAELFGRGSSHVSAPPVPLVKDEALATRINEIDLPRVFAAIRQLVSPKE